MAIYRYECSCGNKLILKDEYIGKAGTCKSCKSKIHITRELVNSLNKIEDADFKKAAQSAVDKAVQQVPVPTQNQRTDTQATLPTSQTHSDVEATVPVEQTHGDFDATIPAQASIGVGQPQRPQDIAKAEAAVALDWNVGDVILDLYEVQPVSDDGQAFHAGGFGKVYKVHHKTWNIDLAVKCPHVHAFQTETQKENFIKECQSWIELGMHPNIASCYYVRELGGVPRIFAEYVDSGSLKEWIESGHLYEEEDKKEALKRMLDVAIQFAWGLHYAHELGMVHQDVIIFGP